jgi:hypothetical protein
MKKTLLLLCVLCISCTTEPIQIKKATKNTSAYSDVNDDLKSHVFIIKKGTQCEIGKSVIGKVDRYFNVTCGDKTAWIVDIENFE